jgi:hypothetical protein
LSLVMSQPVLDLSARATTVAYAAKESASSRVQRARQSEYAAIWIVVFILGIFIIGAAALAIYCIRNGRNGGVIDFNVSRWYKGWLPVGIRVEIKCV